MSSRVKSKPPWQSVGTGAKDVKALNSRPAWQGVTSTRKAHSRSTSPAKPKVNTKRPSQSPPRMTSEYTRSHTLHAYGSDTVSSSTATTNNSVLTGSSVQSLDELPAEKLKKEPVRAPRAGSTAAPKASAQRAHAPRKPAARTATSAAPATRAAAPRTPQTARPSVRGTSRGSDRNRTPKRRGTSRQPARRSSSRTKDKDGWEADSEDSFTVVGVEPSPCVWSGEKDTDDSDVGVLVPVLQPPLTERGAAFAALSDASSTGLPSRESSPCRASASNALDDDDAPGCEPAALPADLESLSSTVCNIQKDLASLRSSLSGPRISSNPLGSPLSSPAVSTSLPPPATMTGASTASTRRLPRGSRSDRARKVPLPPELTSAGLDTNAFSTHTSISGALSESPVKGGAGAVPDPAMSGRLPAAGDLAPMATESSFGLSCGLPGLSHEVSETITHLTAAEVIQESVTVTALSLRDWLLRPTPTPFDPALTLYGAAVHNAHVAGCEVLIGGLLAAIEECTIDRPKGLPSGSCQTAFRARGISDSDAARTVFRSIAAWIWEVSERADRSHAAVMQDPRALPLLSVLRYEALHRIGETAEDEVASESARLQARSRTEQLNATDMLYVLISALFPAFRHLVSRHPEASPGGSPLHSPHGGVPSASPFNVALSGGECDPASSEAAAIATALSSQSLFSIPAEHIPAEHLPDEEDSQALAAGGDSARADSGGMTPGGAGSSATGAEAVTGVESLGMVCSVTESLPSFAAGFGISGRGGIQRRDSVASFTTDDSGGGGAGSGHVRSGIGGGRAAADGDSGTTGSGSGSGGISQEALTDALQRLLSRDGGAAAGDGGDGTAADGEAQSEVDIIGALRQLASERVQAKRAGRSGGSAALTPEMFLEGEPITEEARSAQAAEVDKLLQKPEVIKVLTQLASNAAVDLSGQHIQAAISQSEAARAYAARARNRSKVLEAEMARQRFIINTFANMNMMQQQMASHMFGTLIKSQGPAPGSTEVNAMIRSMAKRQGYQGLTKPLNTPGQSYMHGAVDSALPPPMGAASAMPHWRSMMPDGAPSGAGAPQMSAFGAVQMPYLQMAGGTVPVPNSVLGGGTTFSMAGQGTGPGPDMRAPRSRSAMRGGVSTMRGTPSVVSARGGSTGSTSGSAGRGTSRTRSRTRSHCSSTPKTPTLGGPMFASNRASGGGHHRRSSSQRMPQLQPFGGPSGYGSGYAASDGSRMLQPSSLGSDRTSMNNSTFMQSNSHLQSSSSFQGLPPRRHSSNGSANTLPRPSSGPMAHPQRPQSGQSAYGSPENSRRLPQPRSRQARTGAPDASTHAAKPPKHSRSKSGARRDLPRPSSGEVPSRGHSRGPSRECSPDRLPVEAAPRRGNSSRMMAAVHAARRTLSGSRRRSSSRRRHSPNKALTRSPSPTRPPPIPRSIGESNRGQKAMPLPPPVPHGHTSPPQHAPPPHGHPRPPVANNAMMRSSASSVNNSSFLFDSSSSGYSAQFDSLSSLPASVSGSAAPQAPATPPQPGGSHHRRSNSGGAPSGPLPPLALLPQPATAPVPPMSSPPSGQRSGGGYPGLMPQQIASPGVRRGAPRRMTPQLAATPEVEEEVSSFMEI